MIISIIVNDSVRWGSILHLCLIQTIYIRLGTDSSAWIWSWVVKRWLIWPDLWGSSSWDAAERYEDIYLLCNTNLVCVLLWVKLRNEVNLALILYKSTWGECWWIIWGELKGGQEAKASLGTRARRPHCLVCPVSSAMMFLRLIEVE